jgi:predicted ATPase/DNA-binding SARP family transcriptional activator
MQGVRFRVLGPLEAEREGTPVELGGPRQRAVLVRLLLDRGRLVPVERLIEDVWEGNPPGRAAQSLQSYVSNLRRALEPPRVIVTRAGGYALEGGEVDVATFVELAASGRRALERGDARAAATALREALALWRGPALADVAYASFAQAEITRLDEQRLAASEDLAESEIALGRHAEAATALAPLVAEQPLRERARGLLMRALAAGGRQADALRLYEDGRRALADELGVDPSPELRATHEAILRQERPATAELPTGVVTFLLTDVEGSTRLWERHPSAAQEAIARHDELIASAVAAHGGVLLKTKGEGDSTFSVFASASDAVACAVDAQRAMQAGPWPEQAAIRVRAALHSGEAQIRGADYFGPAVSRCARLRSIASGGQTILSEATAELVRDALPDGASLRDLGAHRLRDLTRPERVTQLCHRDLPDEFPPLRSVDAFPNNLPVQLSTFVGRRHEMAEIKVLLGGHRLVMLTGAGGAGKTRLAIEVGAEVLDAYADGVWFAALAALTDQALVAQTVAAALHLREEAGRDVIDLLAEHLREREALLILDNCEHIVAACASLAEKLLQTCPRLKILATSREALQIAGEAMWRTPSLAVPAETAPPAPVLCQYESVQLFRDRARACAPAFDVDPGNAPAVAEICRRLDGIPLAIELAAARVKTLTAVQIAERLDDRFRLVAGGSRTALPRQQTLRALIDWSYELLTDTERVVFRRLSAFAGGFPLEGAERVCAGEGVDVLDVVDLLERLADKSLVTADEGRFVLLETIREYGLERLREAGEADAVRAARGVDGDCRRDRGRRASRA